MSEQIVDVAIVAAPRQRNTQVEKRAIKDGRIPEDWKDRPEKLVQKDRDARWTLKRAKARPAKDGEKAKLKSPSTCSVTKTLLNRPRARVLPWLLVTSAAAHDDARPPEVLDKSKTGDLPV